MTRRRRERVEEEDPLDFDIEIDEDFDFEEDKDLFGAQRIAVKMLAMPKGKAVITLSELSDKEIRTLAMLKTIADTIPDPTLKRFIYNYLILKRAKKRSGVKEILSIVAGKAWRILQNVQLSRVKKVEEENW
jgi:hypothetical protein